MRPNISPCFSKLHSQQSFMVISVLLPSTERLRLYESGYTKRSLKALVFVMKNVWPHTSICLLVGRLFRIDSVPADFIRLYSLQVFFIPKKDVCGYGCPSFGVTSTKALRGILYHDTAYNYVFGVMCIFA